LIGVEKEQAAIFRKNEGNIVRDGQFDFTAHLVFSTGF